MYYKCVKFRRSCAYKVHGRTDRRESISWIISPFKFWTATIFLHAHLQVVYYKCVKFHKNPISRLGGVCTYILVQCPPYYRYKDYEVELSCLLNFGHQPSFLHAHLQVVYYKCVKFHKNPIRRLGGVALTRYMPPPPPYSWRYYGRTDGSGWFKLCLRRV